MIQYLLSNHRCALGGTVARPAGPPPSTSVVYASVCFADLCMLFVSLLISTNFVEASDLVWFGGPASPTMTSFRCFRARVRSHVSVGTRDRECLWNSLLPFLSVALHVSFPLRPK